jgi:coenzyme F420-reducing hydrogenase gamma subunit
VTPEFELTLIGKPGCHLCDDAEVVINKVLADFADRAEVTKLNILEDESLFARYSEEIPVLLINGKVHNYWHIDPERLREALNS